MLHSLLLIVLLDFVLYVFWHFFSESCMSDLVSHFNVCKQGSVFKQGTDVVLLILLNRSLNLRNRNKLVQFNQDLPKM